jgi:hypothetical protein
MIEIFAEVLKGTVQSIKTTHKTQDLEFIFYAQMFSHHCTVTL